MLAVVEDDELRRAADTEHYTLARRLHCTLISLDRDFFDERRFLTAESGGVIILAAAYERRLTIELARVDRAFFRTGGWPMERGSATAPLVGRKIDVHPDWSLPDASRPREPTRR